MLKFSLKSSSILSARKWCCALMLLCAMSATVSAQDVEANNKEAAKAIAAIKFDCIKNSTGKPVKIRIMHNGDCRGAYPIYPGKTFQFPVPKASVTIVYGVWEYPSGKYIVSGDFASLPQNCDQCKPFVVGTNAAAGSRAKEAEQMKSGKEMPIIQE